MDVRAMALQCAKEGWEKETGEPYEGSGYEMSEFEMLPNSFRTLYMIKFTHPTKRPIQMNLAF